MKSDSLFAYTSLLILNLKQNVLSFVVGNVELEIKRKIKLLLLLLRMRNSSKQTLKHKPYPACQNMHCSVLCSQVTVV